MFSLVLFAAAARALVDLTGDAAKDFADTRPDASGRAKNAGVIKIDDTLNGQLVPDVGVPQLPQGTISGWDVRSLFFQFDEAKDELLIGIDCFGICGDADGNGDPGAAAAPFAMLGGQDLPDLASGESFALFIDLNLDVADVLPSFQPDLLVPYDFVLGVPVGDPDGAVDNAAPGQIATLPCSRGKTGNAQFTMADCFGLYTYHNVNTNAFAGRFLAPTLRANGTAWPVRNANPRPNATQPDLEWVLGGLTELRNKTNTPHTPGAPWTFLAMLFAGSFQDAGTGEDYVASQTDYVAVTFPCTMHDACDVCLGDGRSCADCRSVPNGPAVYDACDVCGGNAATCSPTTTTTTTTTTTAAATTTTTTTTTAAATTTTTTTTAMATETTEIANRNTTAEVITTTVTQDDNTESNAAPADRVGGNVTANALVSSASTMARAATLLVVSSIVSGF